MWSQEVMNLIDRVIPTGQPTTTVNPALNRLGFWSATMTAVFAAAFILIGIVTPAREIPYPYTDVAAFVPADYFWQYPAFLLAPTFVVLMACINAYADYDKKVFSQIGLSLAIIYAATIMINYFLQLTVVEASLLNGETAGLSLITQYNPHGIFIALEDLAYLTLSGALLFAAAVFAGDRIARAVRWLFVIDFIVAVGAFTIFIPLGFGLVTFEVTAITITCIVLVIGGILLSVLFKRTDTKNPAAGISS